MPKILEDPVKRLIAETRRQIREQGYRATTIRSVAKGCGVGVGTVYNYFDSKEQLTAAFLAEFTAEALLTRTVANKSFSDLFSVLYPIIKPKENPHEQF